MNHVVLFHTCLVNVFRPQVGFAVVKVLEGLGATVSVPFDQTCCGQPAFNAGFHDEARVAARHTLSLLAKTSGPIVIPSGSCGDMVIHQYPALLAGDAPWHALAREIAARTIEFSSFLAQHLERLAPMSLDATVTYHPSCHLLRGLGVDREPRAIIGSIAGLTSRPLTSDDECCGFGGLFSVKHPDIARRMLDRKLDHVAACGAGRVISCDMGCLQHIAGGLQRRGADTQVQHIAELVGEAMS